MADFNVSITMSNEPAPTDLSAGSVNNFIISNPNEGSSYFVLETVKNSNGAYDSNSPKNLEGTFSFTSGISNLVTSSYQAGVVVSPEGGTLTFTPTNAISKETLRFRGTGVGTKLTSSLPSFIGLLDEYPGAAASFSTRKLLSTYTGPAIEVRRDSDNAVQDIGFDSNGDLDTNSLENFVNTASGYVRTWYDQSGNVNNVTQTTTANQPQIVNTGSVILKNSNPAIQFNGDTTSLLSLNTGETFVNGPAFSATVSTSDDLSIINDQPIFAWSGDSSNVIVVEYDGTNLAKAAKYDGGYLFNPTHAAVSSIQYLHILDYDGSSNFNFYQNNILSTGNTNPSTSLTSQRLTLGSGTSGAGSPWLLSGSIQEVVLYSIDNGDNRTGIQDNINSYYNIYS